VPFLFVLGPRLAGFALALLDQMVLLVHVLLRLVGTDLALDATTRS
jgi:hypothetical protein